MRKKKVVIGLFIFGGMIIAGYSYYQHYVKNQNVFDQMFYTRVRTHYEWFGGNQKTSFNNMEQLEDISKDAELYSTQEGVFEESYKKDYTGEDNYITIDFYREEKIIIFSYRIEFPSEDERLWMTYTYDLERKKLIKEPLSIVSSMYNSESQYNTDLFQIKDLLSRHNLTLQEIEQTQYWFLYDRILADWLDANKNQSRFSLENLGRFKFVDNTNQN